MCLYMRFGGTTVDSLSQPWTKSAEQTIEISVTRPAKRAIEYGFDGSTAPYPAFAGRTLSHVALRPGTARLFELIP